jgi:ring-1,2-phenylacetyl-CoA epoxidase subunit PaaD
MTIAITNEQHVWDALQEISDPEIPAISIVDLGIVRAVECADDHVAVEIMPTFIGCPAIGVICAQVEERLRQLAPRVEVRVTFEEQWTSERITPRGRANLLAAGYAPPITPVQPLGDNIFPLLLKTVVPCPFCGARNTQLENPFGPTLCRSIYYCNACRQPFEHFKAV